MSVKIETAGDALLADIIADPDDDGLRLIYADWVEEAGGGVERAELIRVQVELASAPRNDSDHCSFCGVHGTQSHRDGCRAGELCKRQRILWSNIVRSAHDAAGRLWGLPVECCTVQGPHAPQTYPHDVYIVRRGFVSEVRCTLEQWQAHGQAVARAHPLECVTLTDRAVCDFGSGFWGWEWRSRSWRQHRWGLPTWLWEALREVATDYIGDRDDPMDDEYAMFATPQAAQGALSRACILWARLPTPETPRRLTA